MGSDRNRPRVFISYSHDSDEHRERVLSLANRLRSDGVDVQLDQYETSPREGWPRWMRRQLKEADFVLVVATETYESRFDGDADEGTGLGVRWEGAILTQELYESGAASTAFVPVFFEDADRGFIPIVLRPFTWYQPTSESGYLSLYRRLTDQPEVTPPPVGEIVRLPPRPDYRDEETRELSQSLETAYLTRAELRAAGKDGEAAAVNERILGLKRRIREGGQLKEGDFLLDGRFQLLESLGRGGFAEVWKAYDRQRRDVVAVKVLHGQYTRDESRRERFFRGARHMARLRHPGIVQVFEEECEDGGYHFFVMEYVGGGDLRQAVKAGGLSLQERLRVIREVGEALGFAHERGVVHRDVKPGNVLLDVGGRPKLTDFDLVKAADTTGGTRTTGLGTFLYAAPEAMMDAKAAAEPADVYGLGMTAVFALHGDDLPVDVLWELPEFVEALEVADRVRAALRRAVARKVGDRWSTVIEFCQALRVANPGRPWTDPVLGIEFVYVEPGEFWMGSLENEDGRRDNETRHRVRLTRGFWMATTAVTQGQFTTFVDETRYEAGSGWKKSGGPDHPVVNVSWHDAEHFCKWLSGRTQCEIRLPTEAEWEYAARAGTETAIYAPKLADAAWYGDNSGGRSHPVGEKQPNAWGLYDMLGNVWEWCGDWFGNDGAGVAVDPNGPEQGAERVFRGGSWNVNARYVRAASRRAYGPGIRVVNLGFRLARGQGRGASAAEPP